MSNGTHFFATTNQKIAGGVKAANKRHQIAKSIDKKVGYTYYYDEARREWIGHAYCENLGHAYNTRIEMDVAKAWAAAGV